MFDWTTTLAVQVLGPAVAALESLSFIGKSTYVVRHPYMDQVMGDLATSSGLDETLLKYTISLFLAYPLAALLYALPNNKQLKHLYSFLVGFTLTQWVFGPDWIHSMITSLGTYLICLLAPRRWQHYIAFFFVMGYMTASHVYRMYVSYMSGDFDFTGTQMVLTMKLTSFAFNLFDGTADFKNTFPDEPHSDRRKQQVYNERRKFAITRIPNPIEFLGYVFCFTCILAGPAFEYKDYERAIDGSAYELPVNTSNNSNSCSSVDDKKPSTAAASAVVVKKPANLLAGLHRLLLAVVSLLVYLQVSALVSVKVQYDPEYIATHGYLERFGQLLIAMANDRLKFYFAWKIAEGASIWAGFGFEGYDSEGKPKGWSGVQNMDILTFETAANVQTITRAWNKRTQGWLERYIYHRTGRSLMATYFISALWHGLYPGFFFMFMTLPIITNIERLIKQKINPLVVPSYDGKNISSYPRSAVGTIYWVFCWFCTFAIMNYTVQTFSMGSLENCLIALGGHYFLPHIFLVLLYAALEVLPSKSAAAAAGKQKKQQ